MRLVLDEHFSVRIAVELRRLGLDVIAVTELATLRASADEDLLRWAGAEGRILVTQDVADFLAIHSRVLNDGERHHGIVLTSHRRFSTDSAGIGALVAALQAFAAGGGTQGGESDVWWL